jgi:tetratricopeptide (TPR) repeat protein
MSKEAERNIGKVLETNNIPYSQNGKLIFVDDFVFNINNNRMWDSSGAEIDIFSFITRITINDGYKANNKMKFVFRSKGKEPIEVDNSEKQYIICMCKGIELFGSSNYDDAYTFYNQAYKLFPNRIEVISNLSKVIKEIIIDTKNITIVSGKGIDDLWKEKDELLRMLELSLKENPTGDIFHAYSDVSFGCFSRVLRLFRTLFSKYPDDIGLVRWLVSRYQNYILDREDQYCEQEHIKDDVIEDVIDILPRKADHYIRYAKPEFIINHLGAESYYCDPCEIFREALHFEPDNPEANLWVGLSSYQAEERLLYLNKYHEMTKDPMILLHLGNTYISLNDHSAGLDCYNRFPFEKLKDYDGIINIYLFEDEQYIASKNLEMLSKYDDDLSQLIEKVKEIGALFNNRSAMEECTI